VAVALAILLIVSLCAAIAQADPEDPGARPADPSPPTPQELTAFSGGGELETDQGAAEELPHDNLGRSGAETLLSSVFPTALEQPAGIYRDLEVEEYHSDHVAVIAPPTTGDNPGLISSLLPLRVENDEGEKQPVNLDLGREGGELQPENPLVPVEIPDNLEEKIALPESGIEIGLAGASGNRTASTVEDHAAAFYPNVAKDSDLAVVPTPTGVETLTQLRSPDAPTVQTFNLALPAGATLEESEDGGAVVQVGGQPSLVVHSPTAIDAAGDQVPVSMSLQGSSLTLHVDPPSDAAYPILVDPVYENYYWMAWSKTSGIDSDWKRFSTRDTIFSPTLYGIIEGSSYSGLGLQSAPFGPVTPGDRASWFYYVPRYSSDMQSFGTAPSSYIQGMSFTYVYFSIEEGAPVHAHPYAIVGLWDENKQGGSAPSVAAEEKVRGGRRRSNLRIRRRSPPSSPVA
jgi:hypothetical protein